MQLTKPERNTIAAALKLYLDQGMDNPENQTLRIHRIAASGDEISLNALDIHALFQRVIAGSTQKITLRSVNEHMHADLSKKHSGMMPLDVFIFAHILNYDERAEFLRTGEWPAQNTASGQKISDLKQLFAL